LTVNNDDNYKFWSDVINTATRVATVASFVIVFGKFMREDKIGFADVAPFILSALTHLAIRY